MDTPYFVNVLITIFTCFLVAIFYFGRGIFGDSVPNSYDSFLPDSNALHCTRQTPAIKLSTKLSAGLETNQQSKYKKPEELPLLGVSCNQDEMRDKNAPYCAKQAPAIKLNMNSSSEFKTIRLSNKTPEELPVTYNQDEMKDIIAQAAKAYEVRSTSSEERSKNFRESRIKLVKERSKLFGWMYEQWEKLKEVKGPSASERTPVGTKTPAMGSSDMVTYPGHDAGFFSSVLEAYNRHYNLRTGPEDWWYCIIRTVALAIDKNSKKTWVRNFFVKHEGKKTLTVKVGPSIFGVDYSWFFEQISQEIAKNINVPDYVDKVKTDFSQSTKIHRIVSEVTLMSSMQEFFKFRVMLCCGIPAIEMKGTQQDWERLGTKITELRKTLKPIEDIIGLRLWWDKVEDISNKLLDTYNGNPDRDWWSRMITKKPFGSGGQIRMQGWFMVDLLNVANAESVSDAPSGLVSVPMTIADDLNGEEEQAAVVAGMIGYKLHIGDQACVPTVEPMHGWSLLLEPNSVLRKEIVAWEQRIS